MRETMRFPTLAVFAVLTAMLLVGEAGPAEAAFPGENGLIAFTSSRVTTTNPTGDAEIFTMNSDGTGLAQITQNDSDDYGPAWNAAGTEIAFLSGRDNPGGEVYKMDADGSNQVRLTNDPAASEINLAWSPGGTRIAYSSNPRGNFDVFVISAADRNGDGNGDDRKRLTRSGASDLQPAFSPSGKRIAFASNRKGNYEVFKMKPQPEGRKNRPANLTNNPAFDDSPDWSPDGVRIAFTSSRDSIEGEVYVMEVSGADQTRLTASTGGNSQPAFSPDGTQIAFRSDRDGNGEIYAMDTDPTTTGATNLTTNATRDSDPDWQAQ